MVAASARTDLLTWTTAATSAANLEWYVRTLIERAGHHGDPFALVNALVGQAAVAPDDPMFHPFLYGSRHGAHHRGGFYGLAGWHDEGHLLRALYEGVALEHRRHVETLTAGAAACTKSSCLVGHSFSVLAADDGRHPGLPVRLGQVEETGRLGVRLPRPWVLAFTPTNRAPLPQ